MSTKFRANNELIVKCFRNGSLHWRHPINFGRESFPDDQAVIDLVRNKIAVASWFQSDFGDLLPSDRLEVVRPQEK